MRVAVRSRYTNIHGGYEETGSSSGRPAFRRCGGGAWIFHSNSTRHGPRWHFGPELPDASRSDANIFFTSLADAASPEKAEWPKEVVDRIWLPDKEAAGDSNHHQTLWLDKDFPPEARSLGDVPALSKEGMKVDWVPVRQLRAGDWKLFEGGISPDDLLQGSIGNCWLVAAMASLAEFPDAVEGLFGQKELSSIGKCEVRLFDNRCKRVELTIDEFIPCHERQWWDEEGTPLFARPNANEAWVLLLEKAFAKHLGTYAQMSGGNCCTAFRAFTGEKDVFVWARGEGETARVEGEWKQMRLADGETYFSYTPGLEARRDSEALWAEVRRYNEKSFLVACSMRATHGQEYVRVDGLVEGHAYSFLQVVDVAGQRLVFLRNPWGNDKRWNGRWSDGDASWTKYPDLRRRLRPEFRCDGAFWMSWVDFQAIFDFVFVCARSMRSGAAAAEHARQAADGEISQTKRLTTNPRRRLAQALPERLPQLNPGARVELIGHPYVDGRLGDILKWDEEKGVYEVELIVGPYWTCPKCGETNKRTREQCNVCGASREAVLPESSRRLRLAPECVVLPPGTEVEVSGLRDFPELNGQLGKVVAYDRPAGRYHVELPDGGVRAIRPSHLIARKPKAQPSKAPPSSSPEETLPGPPEAPLGPAEFSRWVPPAPEPSNVDEPEPPDEVPCAADEEVRRIFEELDDELKLKRDLEAAGRRLRRGQQLLREGDLFSLLRGNARLRLKEIRRPGVLKFPLRLRFARRSPSIARHGAAGAYRDAILALDQVLRQVAKAHVAKQRPAPGCFLFWEFEAPGWIGPPVAAPAPAKAKPPKQKGWAGWVCAECGYINTGGQAQCESCEPG
eukprot:TRINITY_DN32238_c0_g1_i1.p1 TRINITY_DN32238_c0_g1~~TRINITY_DN32238_c0_g1_i1.p1  ORF type:complete len:847 (+),score=195.51 TRINITY_DN32238_c0_g1_i1:81-2621(+)